MNRTDSPAGRLPETANLNQVVLELPLLNTVVRAQIASLITMKRNPDFLTFQQTSMWRAMLPSMLPETAARWELYYRTLYKFGFISKAIVGHLELSGAEPFNEWELAAASALYCWRELAEDQPERFEKIRPSMMPFRMSDDDADLLRLPIAGLFAAKRKAQVVRSSDPAGVEILHTRPEGDIDLADWLRAILEGYAPGVALRWADTGEEITAAGQDAMAPGCLIGSTDSHGNKIVYQRQEGGALVNITKHPDRFRRDLR